MSDFLLDFRAPALREPAVRAAAKALQFCDGTRVQVFERDAFSLVITRTDDIAHWGPFEGQSAEGKCLVALGGRIALDEAQWEAARKLEGQGGLACKAIYNLYRQGGADALGSLNGNFVVILFDEAAHKLYLVNDRCGMYLAYGKEGTAQPQVYGSHPDIVAAALGESQNLDPVSLAEFLMTSRLTFPHTYYRNVQGLEPGHIYSFNLENNSASFESGRRYFDFNFKIDPKTSEWELAQDLAEAFRSAVTKRTWPFLGNVAIGLSGGLDSRVLLAAAGPRKHISAFTLFDEENAEFRVARAIAEACGVAMVPMQRDFEYYGRSAEQAVRLSGGTGPLTCNHYLGVLDRFRELGIQSFLTGCYCDYLLKGLPLNTREGKLSGIQRLAPFKLEFYDNITWFNTPAAEGVMARLKARFPEVNNGSLSDEEWLNVERKRTFPLAYEEDLAQRVIPQRAMPWYLPIVDNDIMAVYQRTPPRFKLNRSLFKKMLTLVCPEKVSRIPDNNTGAPVNASWPRQALHRCSSSLRQRFERRVRDRMATSGSWPNWRHYLRHSSLMQSLWARPNPAAQETLAGSLGNNPLEKSIGRHAEENLALSFNLLTQKIWLDQRV